MAEQPPIVVTSHARAAMFARNVSRTELQDLLTDHEISEPHRGRTRYVRGDLVAVVAEEPNARVVLTVLWRRPEQWADPEMVASRRPQAS